MKNKTIETEIWEDHPEKKGMVRFVKTRKVCDVFKELEERMKNAGMMPDEYFLLSHRFDPEEVMPRDVSIIAYAQWGGNEGVYLEVEMLSANDKQHFATGKTLGETEEDYDRMQAIAGFIYKSFAGFGRVASKEEKRELFVVCIDESYIRDAQCFVPPELTGVSDEVFDLDSGSWKDINPNAFVDTVSAASGEEACKIAADKHGCDQRILFATKVEEEAK